MTPEKLQQEAEQLYPYTTEGTPYTREDHNSDADMQRAAHVVCAEKYTAIIEGLKQKHEERILILALDMQKKDQEIERLRQALTKIAEWQLPETDRFWDQEKKDPMSYGACYGSNGERDYMRNIAINTLNNQAQKP